MRRDPWRDSCTDFPDLMSRLSRLKLSARLHGATFQTNAERALLSKPLRTRRDQEIIPRYQGGGGATFQTKPVNSIALFKTRILRESVGISSIEDYNKNSVSEKLWPQLNNLDDRKYDYDDYNG